MLNHGNVVSELSLCAFGNQAKVLTEEIFFGKFEVLTYDKGSRVGRFVGHPLDTSFGRN